jgi:hypothetical protein
MTYLEQSHHAINAAADWLRPVPWQLFTTLEFPGRARPEIASAKFGEFINTMERNLRSRVGSVHVLESKSKDRGERVPLHIHSALTANKPIDPRLVSSAWHARVGRTDPTSSELVLTRPFDPEMGGIEYILKQIDDPDCEWDFRNVHLFNPNVNLDSKLDHASLRSARRWQQQVSIAAV